MGAIFSTEQCGCRFRQEIASGHVTQVVFCREHKCPSPCPIKEHEHRSLRWNAQLAGDDIWCAELRDELGEGGYRV